MPDVQPRGVAWTADGRHWPGVAAAATFFSLHRYCDALHATVAGIGGGGSVCGGRIWEDQRLDQMGPEQALN